MQNRLKSPALWLAIIALISFILKDWLCVDLPRMDRFAELFLAVMAGLGIVNNPTDKKKF